MRRIFWLPFRSWGTHIQDERELYGSPWLRLSRNHRWSSGCLPSTGGRCSRFFCGASVPRPMRRIWRRRCTCGCCGSRDQEAIRNPVHYLYTVANNLVKEHAVLDRRQASGIDIDEAPAHEQLETLPAFDGDLDATQRVARLGVVLKQLRPKCRAAVELRFTQGLSYPGDRDAPRGVPADGEEVRGAGTRSLSTPHGGARLNL